MDISKTHLVFDTTIGSTKPITVFNQDNSGCPFCQREQLEGVIAEEGPLLLLKNKYPVLQDAYQTVLIENYDCDSELSSYSKEHLHHLFTFGVEHWLNMSCEKRFKSVIFYKNHGPYSGGTIRHPHMQIVGLNHIDYKENITAECFQGPVLARQSGVELNLSDRPKMGFVEFNVRLPAIDLARVPLLADYVQIVVHYLLHHLWKGLSSYNLFFYEIDGGITVKIVPRYVTSPLFVGYSIPQISSRVETVLAEMKQLYFAGQ